MVVQGLNPSKQQCYFIPYGNLLTLSRSYLGTIALTKRLKGVKDVVAYPIYKNDKLDIGFDILTGKTKINLSLIHISLDNIDLTIKLGEFVGIIGHTGSGKSTLIQHFNGILKPTTGDVFIGDMNTKDKELAKSGLRYKIGLVFQYPDYQLFEETIEKDIAFGPKNMGLRCV